MSGIIDHGTNDPLTFDLSGFHAVAHGIRQHTRSGQAATMTVREAVAIARQRNAWMRDTTNTLPFADPVKMTEALDVLCDLADGLQVVA